VVLYELAANQSGATQFQAAEASLREARELEPKNGGVLTALSLVRRQQGDPQQAEGFAREALRLQPDDPKALIELARVLNALPPDPARQSEALDLLRKADNLDLNNPAILVEIGRTLTLRGAWAEASAYLLRANALASTTDTLFLLSRCARELGRSADSQRWELLFKRKQKQGEALKNLLTQLESHPDDAKVRFDLGKLFEEDGQIGKALNYYRSGLQRDPQNDAVRKHLADLIRNSLERGNGAAPR
jgi:Tfp pilus assembly protein PilF